MKLLTKHSDYAIRALIYIAGKPGGLITTKEIAEGEKIPLQFLRRLIQELVKNGLLVSKGGSQGGVKLAKEPLEIGLMDVVRIFQGDFKLVECLFRKTVCHHRKSCSLRMELNRIEANVVRDFSRLTLDSLLEH